MYFHLFLNGILSFKFLLLKNWPRLLPLSEASRACVCVCVNGQSVVIHIMQQMLSVLSEDIAIIKL